MGYLRAYVVKIFNEVFGGGRANVDMSSLANGTDNPVTLVIDEEGGRRTAGEAYLAAIIIGMVRLVSSLLLAQLLTRSTQLSKGIADYYTANSPSDTDGGPCTFSPPP